jgi:hypothetical protein
MWEAPADSFRNDRPIQHKTDVISVGALLMIRGSGVLELADAIHQISIDHHVFFSLANSVSRPSGIYYLSSKEVQYG